MDSTGDNAPTNTHDIIAIGEVAARSGVAASALRYYEDVGLIESVRLPSGRRAYQRHVLRRLAFIKAARAVGISLDDVRAELVKYPADRPLTKTQWAAIAKRWRALLDAQITALRTLRDDLTSCIGCGCLSLKSCALYNPGDVRGAADGDRPAGQGAMKWPRTLR